jgi:hypothetical protein
MEKAYSEGLKCTEAITVEASARAKADQALAETIRIEVADRIAAVAETRLALQTALDEEKVRVDALVAGSNINLTTLVELIAAYESADTNVISRISALQTSLDALTARLDSM